MLMLLDYLIKKKIVVVPLGDVFELKIKWHSQIIEYPAAPTIVDHYCRPPKESYLRTMSFAGDDYCYY